MYKGILVYKGTKLADKVAILPSQVRKKIVYMLGQRDKSTIDYASLILADICGVLLGLRRSEFLAARQKKPGSHDIVMLPEPGRRLVGPG